MQENRTNTREMVAAIDRLAALATEEDGAVSAPSGDGVLLATATGTMLHRPDCPVVANRPGVRRVKASTPGFEPCKICEPELVDLTQ